MPLDEHSHHGGGRLHTQVLLQPLRNRHQRAEAPADVVGDDPVVRVGHDAASSADHRSLGEGVCLVCANHFRHGGVVFDLIPILDLQPLRQWDDLPAALGTSGLVVRVLETLKFFVEHGQYLTGDLVHASVEPLAGLVVARQRCTRPLPEEAPVPRGVYDLIGRIEDHWAEVRHNVHDRLPLSRLLHYEQRLQLRLHPSRLDVHCHDSD
mmetsp:Transcript_40742/g.116505  ORF Transcript_40742/g.116505 Transcript_40742/m.116505 type:complete len:209 (+) Transcript_40742:524-1150(+)